MEKFEKRIQVESENRQNVIGGGVLMMTRSVGVLGGSLRSSPYRIAISYKFTNVL